MVSQRITISILLVLVLGLGFGWYISTWQWWAVVAPSVIVISLAEAIEREIRGWR